MLLEHKKTLEFRPSKNEVAPKAKPIRLASFGLAPVWGNLFSSVFLVSWLAAFVGKAKWEEIGDFVSLFFFTNWVCVDLAGLAGWTGLVGTVGFVGWTGLVGSVGLVGWTGTAV